MYDHFKTTTQLNKQWNMINLLRIISRQKK
jgi:hypothetical protein